MTQVIENPTAAKKTAPSIAPFATHASDTQIAAKYGVSRATIWRWVSAGKFPAPVKLSPGCTRWRLADVEAWEAKQEGGR